MHFIINNCFIHHTSDDNHLVYVFKDKFKQN